MSRKLKPKLIRYLIRYLIDPHIDSNFINQYSFFIEGTLMSKALTSIIVIWGYQKRIHTNKKIKHSQETIIFNVIWPTPYLHPRATPTKIFIINDMDYNNMLEDN